jgi:phage terminase large subunit-like protein
MSEKSMDDFIIQMDKEMCRKSFEYFFVDILGFLFNGHHQSWKDGLEESQYYCVKASRDHGKSVFFMTYALWLAAFTPNKHIMIFSHSLEQTLEHMRFIKSNIDRTDCLRDLIPEGRPWAKSYFEFSNGSRIMAKSVGGATRGFHPDVVVCDDILWGTSGTELQRTADWFYGVLLPVLHHSSKLMMVGTPFSYNDLYAELEQKETFRVETFPAINSEGVALWPERWNIEALEQRRLSMPAIQFSREYLCEPIHDVASMFPMEILEAARDNELTLIDRAETNYNEEGEPDGVFGQHFIGHDPAISSDKNADFTAMTVMRQKPDEDFKEIVHVVHERGMSSMAQKRMMVMLNNKFNPELIELEGNNFQRMLEQEMREMAADMPIRVFMTTRAKKESLFMSLLLAFEQGHIKLPYGDERSRKYTHEVESQLNRFGMQKNGRLESVGVHDDLAMSLALANWASKEFKGTVVLLDDYMPGFDSMFGGGKEQPGGGWLIP